MVSHVIRLYGYFIIFYYSIEEIRDSMSFLTVSMSKSTVNNEFLNGNHEYFNGEL